MSLLVGLPFQGRPTSVEWGIALAMLSYPLNMKIAFCPIRGKKIDEARNEIATQSLNLNAKYLFFVDDDVIVPPNAARRLIHSLERSDAVICGGIYPSKWEPTEPIVYRGEGEGAFYGFKDEPFECDAIGTGCMMIKTSLFKEIEPPWFKEVDELENGTYNYQISDDIYFCRKVKAKGLKILGDGKVRCQHYDFLTGRTFDLS